MRYHIHEGVTKDKKNFGFVIWLFVVVLAIAGTYGAVTALSPSLVALPGSEKPTTDATFNMVKTSKPQQDKMHLYLPQINVDIPVVVGDAAVLGSNALLASEVSDSSKVIKISAVRFSWGVSPWETKKKSPFYNLSKLAEGDEVYLDTNGKRYGYKIVNNLESDQKAGLELQPVNSSNQPDGQKVLAELVGEANAD